MITRNISNKIKKLSNKYPVLSITGPRQSGKTTLVKNLFSNYDYFNLENLDLLEAAKSDPKGFLQIGSRKKMIIDEIQRLPELFSYIQTEVDEQKILSQFVITGSQQFNLNEKITQSLAGRVANFILLPFSIQELNKTSFSPKTHFDFIYQGFYPVIYDRSIPPENFYKDYLFTYIERDVRQIKNIGDLSSFQRFISLTAGRVGQIVNLSSLANDTGVSYKTIDSWLSILEASYIIFRLQPYYENFGKRITKSPKLYFYDTGLLCYLLGINSTKELKTHYSIGHIFENLIIADIYKQKYNNLSNIRSYFWKDNNQNEVDLIIDKGTQKEAIEIKSGSTYSQELLKGLFYWKKIAKKYKTKETLVYAGGISQTVQDVQIKNWLDYLLAF